uniref:Polymerase PB2 n=1 Tax=Hymenopteran orthomyxo-related virus OKIAV173 TaxID=2746349 RepID=A0A7D7FD73_9ORTO|nr:polymerase PB2 [Hymenopteran orthomyxo-related virus OKIAV173]
MDKEEITNLMRCVRLINNADKKTIDLLMKNPMNNLKLIERSSKCLKDPNPLASTMAVMSTKFPLSIDKEKAILARMPNKYLNVREGVIGDTHHHGRILCKKEAIEWWITKSEVPTKETQDVIDILMKQHRKEVSDYYSMNWLKASIKWGQPNLERRRVNTREPLVQIDPTIRDQAIMQALMPDFTIPFMRVTDNDIKQVKDILNISVTSKMQLSTQIRVLVNQMDSRRRVLPVLPGSSDHLSSMKHAIMHSNFVMVGYEDKKIIKPKSMHKIVDKFGKNLHYEFVARNMTIEAARKVIMHTSIHKKALIDYLRDPDLQESNYVKWMKVVIGLPITAESEANGLKTSPAPVKMTLKAHRNLAQTRFITYEGVETVGFKYGDIRGTFQHNGEILNSVVTNYTTFEELRNCMCEIAVYCRWGMRGTRARTYQLMKQEVRDLVRRGPHIFIACAAIELDALINMPTPKGKAGALEIVSSSEYHVYKMGGAVIDGNGDIKSEYTNQTIHMLKTTEMPDPIPTEVRCETDIMMNHFDFQRLLKYKVAFYIKSEKTVKDLIKRGAFKWENLPFVRFMGGDNKILSKMCRDLLVSMVAEAWNPYLAAVYYCFCYPSTLDTANVKYKFVIGSQILDLKATTGILRYDQDNSEYVLFGAPLTRTSEIDYAAPLRSLLDGYRISSVKNDSIDVKSIRYLEEKKDDIEIGETFTVFISGQQYTATRDPTMKYAKEQTVMRQVNARQMWLAGHQSIFESRKRYLGEENADSDEEPEKKKREEEQEEEEFEISMEPVVEIDDTWEI